MRPKSWQQGVLDLSKRQEPIVLEEERLRQKPLEYMMPPQDAVEEDEDVYRDERTWSGGEEAGATRRIEREENGRKAAEKAGLRLLQKKTRFCFAERFDT